MARTRKIINKDSPFLRRLIELSGREPKSLEELAEEFGASRQTVSKWLSAKALPDIDQLEKIANYYKVSTDYLLGRCEVMSPDVNLQAAVDYTGLSEKAAECLHNGFAESRRSRGGASEKVKKEKMLTASQLILSTSFSEILDYMTELPEMALFENIKQRMDMRYISYRKFNKEVFLRFDKKEDREYLIAAIRDANEKGRLFQEEHILEKVLGMSDEELIHFLREKLADIQDKKDLCQFLATKGFNRYLDKIMQTTYVMESFDIRD